MVRIKEVIIVEGKYDKNTLSQVVDATIVETFGFAVFKDRERLELIRKLAEKRGIIVFTDSDGAGFVIRNFLKGAVAPSQIKNAYIPDVPGKEKRKSSPSKEGKLGLEGMAPHILLEALRKCGATMDEVSAALPSGITQADFYALGLSGRADSAKLRHALREKLGLPERMSAKALFQAVGVLMTREELHSAVLALKENNAD
ncbi:MAG: toprim domain-containing protein [Oscillospiraceae bacterium]